MHFECPTLPAFCRRLPREANEAASRTGRKPGIFRRKVSRNARRKSPYAARDRCAGVQGFADVIVASGLVTFLSKRAPAGGVVFPSPGVDMNS